MHDSLRILNESMQLIKRTTRKVIPRAARSARRGLITGHNHLGAYLLYIGSPIMGIYGLLEAGARATNFYTLGLPSSSPILNVDTSGTKSHVVGLSEGVRTGRRHPGHLSLGFVASGHSSVRAIEAVIGLCVESPSVIASQRVGARQGPIHGVVGARRGTAAGLPSRLGHVSALHQADVVEHARQSGEEGERGRCTKDPPVQIVTRQVLVDLLVASGDLFLSRPDRILVGPR